MTTKSNLQVCIPNPRESPSKVRNITKGRRPDGGAAFFLSVAAIIIKARMAVPRNSEKKDDAAVIYSIYNGILIFKIREYEVDFAYWIRNEKGGSSLGTGAAFI